MSEKITFISPSVDLLQEMPLDKKIELCGRVCYKSEDKITNDSADRFLRMIAKRGHTSVFEHGTVYLTTDLRQYEDSLSATITRSPYTAHHTVKGDNSFFDYATTNFRVIYEAMSGATPEEKLDLALDYVKRHSVESTKEHIKRVSLRFVVDRGVSHELVRHRVMSVSQESTRYVNYNNVGFQFIQPSWWDEKLGIKDNYSMEHTVFIAACQSAADNYATLLSLGQTPQQARAVLPNALKTELVFTATIPQWEAWLRLRDSAVAHPDMQIVAKQVRALLCQYGFIEE